MAEMTASGKLTVPVSQYANNLTSLPLEYRDMINEFVRVYACSMLGSFVIIDGKCITSEVRFPNVPFGKFKFNSITVQYEQNTD